MNGWYNKLISKCIAMKGYLQGPIHKYKLLAIQTKLKRNKSYNHSIFLFPIFLVFEFMLFFLFFIFLFFIFFQIPQIQMTRQTYIWIIFIKKSHDTFKKKTNLQQTKPMELWMVKEFLT
jgi:hypothetical protein